MEKQILQVDLLYKYTGKTADDMRRECGSTVKWFMSNFERITGVPYCQSKERIMMLNAYCRLRGTYSQLGVDYRFRYVARQEKRGPFLLGIKRNRLIEKLFTPQEYSQILPMVRFHKQSISICVKGKNIVVLCNFNKNKLGTVRFDCIFPHFICSFEDFEEDSVDLRTYKGNTVSCIMATKTVHNTCGLGFSRITMKHFIKILNECKKDHLYGF